MYYTKNKCGRRKKNCGEGRNGRYVAHIPRPSLRLGRGVHRQIDRILSHAAARTVRPVDGVSTGDARHLLSLHRCSSACSHPGRWLLLVRFADAKSTPWTDGIIHRVSVQDTGGTGGIHAPEVVPTSTHTTNLHAGRPSKGTLADSGRGTIPLSFTERFGNVARFVYLRGVG